MKQVLLLVFIIPLFNFSQIQIGEDIDGEEIGDESGYSVSLSSDGSIVAIGAPLNTGEGPSNRSGHVRVYKNESSNWIQIGQDIDGESQDNFSGYSLSLSSDGSIIAIGAPTNNGINGMQNGHTRIYKNESDNWIQIGQDIDGESQFDRSGYSLSLSSDGSVIAIGARNNNGINGINSGHVRVYKNESGNWIQIGQDIDGEGEGDESGRSVSLSSDGSIIAIGARNNNGINGINSGHVRVYKNESGNWIQIGQDIDGEREGDDSGRSVSLSSDGSIIAIGAPLNDEINGFQSGHVRIYENQLNNWVQIGQDIDGEGNIDHSGSSLSLSSNGLVVAVGASQNLVSGHVRVYDLNGLLSIEESYQLNIDIFPNPAQNQFTIQLENISELLQVTIYNFLGQEVLSSKQTTINTSKLISGTYLVEVVTTKGKITKKLIIE